MPEPTSSTHGLSDNVAVRRVDVRAKTHQPTRSKTLLTCVIPPPPDAGAMAESGWSERAGCKGHDP